MQYQRIHNAIDAERAWRDFDRSAQRIDWPSVEPLPYIRFNPDFGSEVPALDAKHDIPHMRSHVRAEMQKPAQQTELKRVAHQLIASTFFFVRTGPLHSEQHAMGMVYKCRGIYSQTDTKYWVIHGMVANMAVVIGEIRCRFETNSSQLSALGRFLQSQQQRDFREQRRFTQPYWIVQEQMQVKEILKVA